MKQQILSFTEHISALNFKQIMFKQYDFVSFCWITLYNFVDLSLQDKQSAVKSKQMPLIKDFIYVLKEILGLM